MPDPVDQWRILLRPREQREASFDQLATLAAQYFDGLRRINLSIDPQRGGRAPWPRRTQPLLPNTLIRDVLTRGRQAVDGLIGLNQRVIGGGVGGRAPQPPPNPAPNPPPSGRTVRASVKVRLRSDKGAFREAGLVVNTTLAPLPVRLLTPANPPWLLRLRSEASPDPLPEQQRGDLTIVGHVRSDTKPGLYELTVGLERGLDPSRIVLALEVQDL